MLVGQVFTQTAFRGDKKTKKTVVKMDKKYELIEMLAKNDLSSIFDSLYELLKNDLNKGNSFQSNFLDILIATSSKYHKLSIEKHLGVITRDDEELELAKIRQSLLFIVNQIPENYFKNKLNEYKPSNMDTQVYNNNINFKNTIIAGLGVGEIKIGMGEKAIISILGSKYEKTNFRKGKEFHLCYYSKGISIAFKNNSVEAIFLYSGLVLDSEVEEFSRFACQTDNGITMDSDFNVIIDKFGKPLDGRGIWSPSSNQIEWIAYDGIAFTFIPQSGKIYCITISKNQL